MLKEIKTHFGVIILIIFSLLFIVFSLVSLKFFPSFSPLIYKFSTKTYLKGLTLKTFSSPEDFKKLFIKN
jgi:hypothetical protein